MIGCAAHLNGLSAVKVRPDRGVVVWPQVLQPCERVDFVKIHSKRRACRFQSAYQLIQVLLVNFERCGDFAPALRCVVWKCHTNNSSAKLDIVKRYARFIFKSYS